MVEYIIYYNIENREKKDRIDGRGYIIIKAGIVNEESEERVIKDIMIEK